MNSEDVAETVFSCSMHEQLYMCGKKPSVAVCPTVKARVAVRDRRFLCSSENDIATLDTLLISS